MRLIFDVDPTTGCWLWQRGKTNGGYGMLWDGTKSAYTHRLVYEAAYGPIPDGLTIDHLCRNPGCMNPGHLETVPHMVNVQRGKSQKHPVVQQAANRRCRHGHWLNEENTYNNPSGKVQCRRCQAERMKRYRRRGDLKVAEPEKVTA